MPALICALLTLGCTATARAQSVFGFAPGGGKLISATVLPASVTGEMGIDFHGDPATGCAALAACAYRGTIAWNPGGGGTLGVFKFRQGGRVHIAAALLLGDGGSSLTAATVRRFTGGEPVATCADEQPAPTFLEASSMGPT